LYHTALKLTFVINKHKSIIIKMKTKSLIAAVLLTASTAFAQVPSYVPTNGLVGWWPFNGNANDESGNGNNGTVNGATLTMDRNGNVNSGYSFNGNSIISVNSTQALCLQNQFSISIWVIRNNSNFMGFISKQRSIGNGSYHISGDGNVAVGINNDPGGCSSCNIGSGSSTTTYNTWHHYVGVWDGIRLKFYDNRTLISDVNGVLPNNNNLFNTNFPLEFGSFYTAYLLDGKLDDIGLWNRALTQQEITNLYNAQTCIGNISADGPTTFCAGNYVNLTSDVVGGTYQWKKNGVNISTNATTKTYKATTTGSYTCVATCNGTVLTSNAIAVTSKTNASATVSASGATSFCAGDSVTLNATNLGSNYSVQWYRTNISMENATTYSQVVKQPGTYKVVTKNLTTGCSRISGSAITTSVNCRIAGDVTSGSIIQENTIVDSRFINNELSQGVHIFPNPNSGIFSFNYDGEETGDAILQIINNMGQSIYQSRLTIPEGGFTQDLQLGDNITKGIYIVRLLINDSYHDSKVMVK
jgi:hypothetical protein